MATHLRELLTVESPSGMLTQPFPQDIGKGSQEAQEHCDYAVGWTP